MTKSALLKKLEIMLDDAEQARTYGTIEIQISDGTPALLRKSTTEKLCTGEPNRARRFES